MGLSYRPIIIGTATEILAFPSSSLEEGVLAYATDTNQAYRYTGSTWAVFNAASTLIDDAGGYTLTTTVEAALQELYNKQSSAFKEDFFVKAIDATNGIIQGASTGTTGNDVPFAVVANGLGGTAQVATGTDANAAAEISGPISFKPSTMGPIWMEARFKAVAATTPTDGDFYVGWSDARTVANNLSYVVGAAGTTTTGVPTEAAVIGYTSVTQTSGPIFAPNGTGTLFVLTTTGGADTVVGTTTAVTKDSNYHIYRVEISVAGTVTAYIDGVLQKTVASAVAATTALAPYINVVTKAAHENTVTIDYITAGAAVMNAV